MFELVRNRTPASTTVAVTLIIVLSTACCFFFALLCYLSYVNVRSYREERDALLEEQAKHLKLIKELRRELEAVKVAYETEYKEHADSMNRYVTQITARTDPQYAFTATVTAKQREADTEYNRMLEELENKNGPENPPKA